ncbi:hypothetical protein [Burkholderia aenigmatica]|uniref:hypothetical protein n=1 Tax=Burkholderia aenigmatica TaxID=2015348 RepID=UPI00264C7508|nr:hypothetical protein [Burkholderia aenigmatica]MDN7880627.1 hypothetical protein [Burkholderia aenigmatica]
MRTTFEFTRGYAAGRARERAIVAERDADAQQALAMALRLGRAIESSSQEKIVGLTSPEREIVEFYRAHAARAGDTL